MGTGSTELKEKTEQFTFNGIPTSEDEQKANKSKSINNTLNSQVTKGTSPLNSEAFDQ